MSEKTWADGLASGKYKNPGKQGKKLSRAPRRQGVRKLRMARRRKQAT